VAGVEVWLHSFLTLALDGDEWSPPRPDRFIPKIEPQYLLKWRFFGPQRERESYFLWSERENLKLIFLCFREEKNS